MNWSHSADGWTIVPNDGYPYDWTIYFPPGRLEAWRQGKDYDSGYRAYLDCLAAFGLKPSYATWEEARADVEKLVAAEREEEHGRQLAIFILDEMQG